MTKPGMRSFLSFGIVPAAGHSRRMGQPKLKLPWGGRTVIEQVVAAWRDGGVDHVVAVVRDDDAELAGLCEQAGAIVIRPAIAPPHMKDSVSAALAAIERRFQPPGDATWMLAPADMPRLSGAVIQVLLDAHNPVEPAILVPVHPVHRSGPAGPACQVKRGHPVLFPWPLSQDVTALNEDEGVNALLKGAQVREVAVDEPTILDDLDTPDDYRRLTARDGHE